MRGNANLPSETSGGIKYTSVRLAADLSSRIANLVDRIEGRTGLRPTTASVITMAIKAGLPDVEDRNGIDR